MSVSMIAATTLQAVAAVSQAATAAVEASVTTGTTGVGSFITTTVPSIVASILPSGITTAPGSFGVGLAVTVPPAWELLAVFVGAVSGALAGLRAKFDVVGISTLAIVTGMGGGILRDVLLQRYGIAAFQDNRYLLTALIATALVFFFAEATRKLTKPMEYIDAVSLGLFVVVGADKALRADLTILPAIMLGVITATGGSVVRDLLTGEVPAILRPGALYSFAAIVGSTTFVLAAVWLDVVKEFAALFAITLTVGLRVLSMWRGWQTPLARDYTGHVVAIPRRLLDAMPLRKRKHRDDRPL